MLVLVVGGRGGPLVVLRRVGVVRRRGALVPVGVRMGGRRGLWRRRRVAGAGAGEAVLVVVRVHGGGAERRGTGRGTSCGLVLVWTMP